jgi:fructose-1,6-bisphosphatase/inositol monophosphatase family enzyme
MNPTLLKQVAEIAKEAGDLLRDRAGVSVGVIGAVGKDIKTRADQEAEELILRRLNAVADHPVLAEESGAAFDHLDDGLHWVVDPLDGTLNQSRSIPLACVSIALWQGDRPLLGVVYDFHRDELFAGEVGRRPTCNETEIMVSETPARAQGVLCTGFPSFRSYEDEALLPFVREVQSWGAPLCRLPGWPPAAWMDMRKTTFSFGMSPPDWRWSRRPGAGSNVVPARAGGGVACARATACSRFNTEDIRTKIYMLNFGIIGFGKMGQLRASAVEATGKARVLVVHDPFRTDPLPYESAPSAEAVINDARLQAPPIIVIAS